MDLESARFRLPALLGLVIFLLCMIGAPRAKGTTDSFRPVKEHLVQSGLSRSLVERSFKPKPEMKLKTVASALRIREASLDYNQYLEPWALNKGERFLRDQRQLFNRAESAYAVDRQTITAVLLVETRIGAYTGITPVVDILATLSLMDLPEYQDRIWGMLSTEDQQEQGRKSVNKRLASRAKRARKDLKALLAWYEDRPEELASLKGSIMGAVGWPQFLPDNVRHYGADGNNDGRIDLFDPADAVFSVAKYLQASGWRAESLRSRQRAVLRYNHSRPYMRTVMRLAELLKGS